MSSPAVPLPFPRLRLPDWEVPWYALAPLLLIPLIGGSPAALNNILFAVELLLLAAGTRRAVWIPAALIVSEMTSSNYMHEIGGLEMSNRLLLSFLAFLVVMPYLTRRIEVGTRGAVTIGLACAFLVLTTFVNMVLVDYGATLEFLRFIATGIFLMVLIPISIRDKDDVLDLGKVLLVIAGLAAVVAIFQNASGSLGTPLYEVIPHAGAAGDLASWDNRALALSENPILASNVQMIVGLFALGVVLLAPISPQTKRLVMLLILLMAAASYLTFTRSWVLSAGVALAVLATFYRGKYWREFLVAVVVGASAFWYVSGVQESRYSQTIADDSSAAARPVLWELSLNIATDNPWFGIGYDQFREVSPEYAATVSQTALERQNAAEVIGIENPHNDVLNVWLSWGFLALMIYVALAVAVALNFIYVYRNAADQVIRGLAMGGLAAIIAYETNSLFHNFIETSLVFWIIAGFSLVLPKVDRPPIVTGGPFSRFLRNGKDLAWREPEKVRQ
ncbi:MAG: O-antigen ligase family protein [Chloroflexi bacterium]|nr:O-antigen ligase family protein [Chloroflexota bacterium]